MSNTFWSLICFSKITTIAAVFITVIVNNKISSISEKINVVPWISVECSIWSWINNFKFLFFSEREYKCICIYMPFTISRIKFNTWKSTKSFAMFTFNNIKNVLLVVAFSMISSAIKSILSRSIQFFKLNLLSIEPRLNKIQLNSQINQARNFHLFEQPVAVWIFFAFFLYFCANIYKSFNFCDEL